MLVLVLTDGQNDPVILCMRMPAGKGSKETENDHEVPVSRMFWNCLEDSKQFYTTALVLKDGSVSDKKQSRFRPAKQSLIYA